MNKQTENKNGKKWFTPKRIFLGVLSLSALGAGFWYASRKTNKPGADDLNTEENSSDTATEDSIQPKKEQTKIKEAGKNTVVKSESSKKPASDFPIKKGSRSEKVRQLQKVMMAKYPGVLKSADGIYGSETEKFLKSKGLPTEISESQFKILTAIDPKTTAQNIYNAAKKKDFKATLEAVSEIKNTSDYQSVNELFKPMGLLGGSNTTIVTGLLLTFTEPSQKDQLSIAFTEMGLEKKDDKWFIPSGVSGIERKSIITTRPTSVWRNARHLVKVGNNTILGYEVASSNGITVFDTIDGYRLNVITSHVKYN